MSILQRLAQGIKAHGNVYNTLKATAPSQAAYNVGVNADLASRISQGLGSIPVAGPALSTLANVAMPAAAFTLVLFTIRYREYLELAHSLQIKVHMVE